MSSVLYHYVQISSALLPGKLTNEISREDVEEVETQYEI